MWGSFQEEDPKKKKKEKGVEVRRGDRAMNKKKEKSVNL